jgi:cell wall-associated NlpC family hydrolase
MRTRKHPAAATASLPQRAARVGCLCLLLSVCIVLCGCGTKRGRDMSAPSAAQDVVKSAYSQIGKKYVTGGSSPRQGFDCSGLVWWAFKQHGIKVPRITTDQAKAGTSASLAHLRPGDIVVFRTGGRSRRGLHTGIYAGNGTFIHSPSRGDKVRTESIDDPVWQEKLIAARRVI